MLVAEKGPGADGQVHHNKVHDDDGSLLIPRNFAQR